MWLAPLAIASAIRSSPAAEKALALDLIAVVQGGGAATGYSVVMATRMR